MSSRKALRPTLNGLRQVARATSLAGPYSTAAVTRPLGQAAARRLGATTRAAAVTTGYGPAGARRYSQQADSKTWSFEDIQKLTRDAQRKVVIVDVREPGELKSTGHIPHAINIPVTSAPDSFHITDEEFEDRFGYPRPGKEDEVVFYCKAGVRSRAAAGLAREAGWTRVGEYSGSWVDWAEKGGEVER